MKAVKLIKPLANGTKHVARLAGKHSNWILAVIAALGLGATAFEFTRATIKAVKLCEEKQVKGAKNIIKTVWKLYIPGVGIVIATTIAIFGNAHSNAKKLMQMTSAYVAGKADMKQLKDKAKEILGEGKEKKIEDEVERDKVKNTEIPPEEKIIKTGHGNDLFLDGLTGQWFRASPDFIELQLKTLSDEMRDDIDNNLYVHRYIELFGLNKSYIGNWYWSMSDLLKEGYKCLEADITACQWMTVNGKQEMVSTFEVEPKPERF